MRPIEEGWQSYLKKVVNPANSARQIEEMRRVFYAGAMIAFVACTSVAPDEVSEDDGVATLQAIHNDIEAFQAELIPTRGGVN